MANRIGVLKGTFLKPGVSKNRRLYTAENIGKAVERMKTRIASGRYPTMMASHLAAADDDTLKTVGRITSVYQREDGSAAFEADIAPTTAGKDIATLVTPDDPYLKTVSIRGAWAGDVKKVTAPDGEEAYTSDDLDIEGVDWTGRPGVEGAEIHYAAIGEARPENAYRIYESVEEAVFVEEVTEGGNAPGDGSLPYGKVKYADPGYQKDGKKRYPIDTKGHVRAAWSYINKAKNAGAYSSAQLSRIKGKIKSAARKFGINIAGETEALIADIESSLAVVREDAANLHQIATEMAFEALCAMYPTYMEESESIPPDDDNMETALGGDGCPVCGHTLPEEAMFCPTCGSPLPPSDEEPEQESEEGAPVATETQAVVEGSEAAATEASKTTFTLEDVLAAYAAGVAGASASAGPKPNKPGTPGTSPDQPKPVESASASGTPEEGTTMPTGNESAAAPALFTSEQVEEMVQKAAKKAAKKAIESMQGAAAAAATEAAAETETTTEATAPSAEELREAALQAVREAAVAEYRQSGAGLRKGLVEGSPGGAAGLTEADLDPRKLAEMSPIELRRVAFEAANSHPFFKRLFDAVDANAAGL